MSARRYATCVPGAFVALNTDTTLRCPMHPTSELEDERIIVLPEFTRGVVVAREEMSATRAGVRLFVLDSATKRLGWIHPMWVEAL